MKTKLLPYLCVFGLLCNAAAQSDDAPPADAPAAAPADVPVAEDQAVAAPAEQPAAEPAPEVQRDIAPTPPPRRSRTRGAVNRPAETSTATAPTVPADTADLRLNFRNAPLDTVLNYLSEAAGFIIDLRTEVKGKVNVWSNQPVTREEALDLLNSALDKNGYTAVRRGRTLTIWTKEDAKRQDLPVKSGNRPEDIPKNDEMVTQIIPVRFINAVQVSRDLQALLPEKATMTANEGGNAILITDSQVNIRRMAEIIKALDTAISSVSSVRVFPLKYADAKALATVIKDLFAPQDTTRTGTGNNASGAARFLNQFRGQGGGGGFPGGFGGGQGGGGQGGGNASSGGRAPSPRVVAVAEERSNSVVVSAPEEQMPVIVDLVNQVDTSVEDVTELRVFRLKFADAQETADLLTSLFSDTTSSSNNQNNRGQIRFGGPFGGFAGGGRNTSASAESARLQKQSKVVAVPDLRTGSVVVSAARDLMGQIGQMIEDLDADPAKKQQVYVFDVQNTDPQAVQEILQSLFPAPAYGNTANSRLTGNRGQNAVGNQLNNRATQNQNQGMGLGGNNGFGNLGTGGFGGGSSSLGGR